MNETKLSSRQKIITNIVSQSDGLLREEIQKELSGFQKVSKPTLIRDLNKLIKEKVVRLEGKGKNTKYYSFSQNPLLRYFNLDSYFDVSPDERTNAKKFFDFQIYKHLENLFSKIEIEKIENIYKSFDKQTKKLNPDILKKELERFVIELSWKSSKIEGNTYTLLETENLILKNQKAPHRSKEEAIMIINHKKAFDQILKNRSEFKNLSLSLVNQLHNLMVKDLSITPGIRKQAVGITGTVYKPLDNKFQIEEAMQKLIKSINKNKEPLEKALLSNSMISYIQPYSDGNKRTGRMLTNAILLAYDYYPLSYRSIDEQEFKKALILFYEQGSLYHLKRLFIEQLIFAYKNYFG